MRGPRRTDHLGAECLRERHGPGDRHIALAQPVELTVMTRERFPEPVEVAAYFVASESMANSAKHSRAARIDVVLRSENEKLLLSVCQDGIGARIPLADRASSVCAIGSRR